MLSERARLEMRLAKEVGESFKGNFQPVLDINVFPLKMSLPKIMKKWDLTM